MKYINELIAKIIFQDRGNNRSEGVVYGLFEHKNKLCLIGASAQKNHTWMQSYKGRVHCVNL